MVIDFSSYKKPKFFKMLRRKIFHLVLGLGIVLSYLITPNLTLIFLIFAIIIGFFLIINNNYEKIGFLKYLANYFSGISSFPILGAFYFVLSSFISFILFNSITPLLVLTFSDFFAAIIGFGSKNKLFFNKNKSILGSFAFFISTMILFNDLSLTIRLFSSLIITFVESLPSEKIDDNLTIPIITGLILQIF